MQLKKRRKKNIGILSPTLIFVPTQFFLGGRYKSWKRRWFILNDNCLYYFEFTTDKEPRGIIPLENIRVRDVIDRSKPHCFELFSAGNEVIKACKTDSEGKVVEGEKNNV